MFINYSVTGMVSYEGRIVDAEYKLINLTKNIKSHNKNTISGYYDINLTNYKDIQLGNNDVMCVEFNSRINGNDYFNRIYNVIDFDKENINIDSKYLSDWNYTSHLDIVKSNIGKYNLELTTTKYQNIYYEIFYLFNNEYVKLDSFTTTDDNLEITFNFNGDYLFKAYSIVNERMMSYCENKVSVKDIINTKLRTRRYVEWE